ncbi:keratin-associated protein 13-2-like [Tamandua tetradactyla]|uniref:keratin-associated protein 13-2-like n=1 Tax=Tamandua tetradactyla TaxID=48850 RepID=UPI0040542923
MYSNCCSGNFSSRSLGASLCDSGSSYGSSYPSNLVYTTDLCSPSTYQRGSFLYSSCQETCCKPRSCYMPCVVSSPCQSAGSLGFGSRSSCSPGHGTRSSYSQGCRLTGFKTLGYGVCGFPSLGYRSGPCRPTCVPSRSCQSFCYRPTCVPTSYRSTC